MHTRETRRILLHQARGMSGGSKNITRDFLIISELYSISISVRFAWWCPGGALVVPLGQYVISFNFGTIIPPEPKVNNTAHSRGCFILNKVCHSVSVTFTFTVLAY
jgi:hypothetical protein